ncbi:MAG TPA: cytochrome c biogenesis protein CcsA [Smithella sp.]|nr:cytochrome c biogenesis protein CcsA [Smithella sp.]
MTFSSLEWLSFQAALVLSAFSTTGYLSSLLVKRVRLAKISTWILAIAFVFLTVKFLFDVIHSPWLFHPDSRDFLAFCAWAGCAVYLVLQFKTKTRVLGAFISPLILLFLIAAADEEAGKSLWPQNLQNWLTTAHLFLTIFGEALFVIASCAGLMFVMQNRLLKSRQFGGTSRLLPSLSDLDRINHLGLLWGFPMVSAGIIAGVIFAEMCWKTGWMTDPKIIWTFAAWIIYGFLLHQRLAIGWKGYRMAVISGAAFILLLASYCGVKLCFSTLHNFI